MLGATFSETRLIVEQVIVEQVVVEQLIVEQWTAEKQIHPAARHDKRTVRSPVRRPHRAAQESQPGRTSSSRRAAFATCSHGRGP